MYVPSAETVAAKLWLRDPSGAKRGRWSKHFPIGNLEKQLSRTNIEAEHRDPFEAYLNDNLKNYKVQLFPAFTIVVRLVTTEKWRKPVYLFYNISTLQGLNEPTSGSQIQLYHRLWKISPRHSFVNCLVKS